MRRVLQREVAPIFSAHKTSTPQLRICKYSYSSETGLHLEFNCDGQIKIAN